MLIFATLLFVAMIVAWMMLPSSAPATTVESSMPLEAAEPMAA